MSRRIFRYLFFYLSVSAILVCGSSRRIPRASCPSCSQDCPEALTVQLPWYPGQESNNLPSRVLRDFPVNSLRNSLHSNLIQERISQDTTRNNNILPSRNSAFLGNYKNFSPQEPASRNLFFKNLLNKFPKFLNEREIFSRDKSAGRYPLARVLPSKQIFRSENVFRDPRNKYSSSSLEDRNFENNIKDKKDPTNKMLIVYHADKNTEPLNSRDASASNILPQRFSRKIENTFRFRRDPIPRIFDEKRNTIEKSPTPVNQQYSLTYPRKGYNSADFVLPEIKRDPYVHPLGDTNIWKPMKNDEFLSDNWNDIKDSSQSLNLKQLKQTENNFLEMYPAKEIIIEDNNEQIDKSYMLPQNLDAWELTDDRESFDDWDYAPYKNLQESAKINQLQEAGNDLLQMFPVMEKNIEHFENERGEDKEFAEQENINQEYVKDEMPQDATKIEQSKYNPYAFSQNNWQTIQDKEFFDNLDFTRKNSQKTDQLEMYSEENNDKFFQHEGNEDIIFENKIRAGDDRINHPPVINAYNAYILPRHLNILGDAKYSVDSSEIQKIPEAKNNILCANPIKERNERFFVDEDIIQNDAPIQDLILPKDIFDMDEYSSHITDKKNIRDNTQDLTRLDPDLLDDVEDLPLESTESTSIESFAEFSTPEQ